MRRHPYLRGIAYNYFSTLKRGKKAALIGMIESAFL